MPTGKGVGGSLPFDMRIHPFTPIDDGSDMKTDSEPNTAQNSGSRTPVSMPPTPSAEETNGILFTPRRAMMSFENLVALANHQERLKEARKMVWRDRGQPVVELDTLRQCWKHAMSGGFRELLFRSMPHSDVRISEVGMEQDLEHLLSLFVLALILCWL